MTYLTVGAAIVAVIAVIYAVGRKKRATHLDAVEQIAATMTREHQAELFGRVAYHGGVPQFPKPCIMYLGVAGDGIVLYDNRQLAAKVPFSGCGQVEQFAMKAKAGNFMKSTVLLGPLVPYFFRDKTRHFVTVEHLDVNNEENNLLLETAHSETRQQLHAVIDRHRRQYGASAG